MGLYLHKMKMKPNVTLNEAGTHAIMSTSKGNPVFTAPIKELHSFDVDGQDGITIDVQGWGEFTSYDEGKTFQESF